MPFDPKAGEHDLAAVLTLELLFRTEMDFVMNTARRAGLSDADAEDVTQQVFLALQRRFHTLQSPESVRPWLLTVTRRHVRALRAEMRDAPTDVIPDDIGEVEDEGPLAEEQLLTSERRRAFLDLLEAIEPDRRMVLVMYALDEIPMSEIAEALRIPISTAYNRLRLAREDLRIAFARKDMSDEYGFLFRNWSQLLTVRDPWEFYYGRAAIVQAVRDRIWARILEALRRDHPSLEAAEVDALRILSPIWKTDAKPRRYPRLPRPPEFAKSYPLPVRQRATDGAATGSRTPSVADRTSAAACPRASRP